MDEDYRVNLDVYNGPLDLLLYLIRRDEVDIHDIPIARITEQFVQYVEVIKQLDPNLVGDFLVVAATLMEIKTRMLLPSAPECEEDEDDFAIDPRGELVRQLLEYKRFKDAAGDLNAAASLQSMQHPRQPGAIKLDSDELDLEDVQVWDLMGAFAKVMESIGQGPKYHEVIYDDTPIELHELDITDRLQRDGSMPFGRVFEGAGSRGQLVGLFMALLELVRLQRVFARQEQNFGEIFIELNPNPPSLEELVEMGHAAPAKPTDQDGQYAPTEPSGQGNDIEEDLDEDSEEDDEDDRDEDSGEDSGMETVS